MFLLTNADSPFPERNLGGRATSPAIRPDQGCRWKIQTETANGLGAGVPSSPWGVSHKGASVADPAHLCPRELLSQTVGFPSDRLPPASICPRIFRAGTQPGGFFQKIQPEMEMVAEWRVRIPLGRLSHEERFQRGRGRENNFKNYGMTLRLFRCTEEKKFVPPVHTYSEKEVFHANKTAFHHRCLKGIGGSSSQDHLCPLHGTTERASTASESSCLHRDRSGADQDFFPTRPRSKIETTSWRRNDFPP